VTRRPLVISTVVSMLLCLVVVELWRGPDVRVVFLRHGKQWEASSQRGILTLTNAPQVEAEGAQRQAAMMPSLYKLLALTYTDRPEAEAERESARAAIQLLQASPRTQAQRYSVPDWLLIVLLMLVTPSLRAMMALRARHRRRMGRCMSCGYNLCASKGRCPECGTPIPSNAKAPA
jgi:hypothetical protein